MGMYSDNFYSWLDQQYEREKMAIDAMPNGYRHPDGSPCRAKSIENCPKYKASVHELIDVDDVDPIAQVQKKSTTYEYNKIKVGDDPETQNVRKVTPDEILTLKPDSTKSKYRKMRNAGFEKLLERKKKGEDINGTYPLNNPLKKVQHKGLDGKMHDGFADGWQVSFQTTNGEGFNKNKDNNLMLSDEEYDSIVEELIQKTGSQPYLGVFGDIPEISFRCDSKELAKEIAEKYNQVSIANNKRIAAGIIDGRTFPKTKGYDWRKNQTFVMV